MAGEQGLVIEFGDRIDSNINARVHQTAQLIKEHIAGIVLEVVPTYRSLMVYFDPLRIERTALIDRIKALLTEARDGQQRSQENVVLIPVCYGGEYGPDLPFVAQHNHMSEHEVVAVHTATPYLVYMLGFTPGFPYLGGMSEKIATPRLSQPRTKIPAGSVGIAGSQTGFYPIESPGGWQLIGRTPVKAFDAAAQKTFLFNAGDYLQFQAISSAEYEEIRHLVATNNYRPTVKLLQGGVIA